MKNKLGTDPLLDEIVFYKAHLRKNSVEEQYEKICQIMKETPDINRQDKDGKTYLMVAVSNYKVDIVELLLKNGANPNQGDKNNVRPLAMALIKRVSDRRKIVELLLEYGADPSLSSKSGQSPMDIAKLIKDEEMQQLLQN